METVSSVLSKGVVRRALLPGRVAMALACFVTLRAKVSAAQSPIGRTYVALSGGFAVGPGADVRNGSGVTGSVSVGRQWLSRLAGELELGGEWTAGGGIHYYSVPCPSVCPPSLAPSSDAVSMLTLAGNAVIGPERGGPGGFLLAGLGMRYLANDPVDRRRGAPIAQLGMGAAVPLGAHALLIGARIQRALSDTRALPWTVPLTVTWRY